MKLSKFSAFQKISIGGHNSQHYCVTIYSILFSRLSTFSFMSILSHSSFLYCITNIYHAHRASKFISLLRLIFVNVKFLLWQLYAVTYWMEVKRCAFRMLDTLQRFGNIIEFVSFRLNMTLNTPRLGTFEKNYSSQNLLSVSASSCKTQNKSRSNRFVLSKMPYSLSELWGSRCPSAFTKSKMDIS